MLIFLSTFVEMDRYMMQKLQDIMDIAWNVEKPQSFVTMTCNLNWPEVKSNFAEQQMFNYRKYILSGDFGIKMKHIEVK